MLAYLRAEKIAGLRLMVALLLAGMAVLLLSSVLLSIALILAAITLLVAEWISYRAWLETKSLANNRERRLINRHLDELGLYQFWRSKYKDAPLEGLSPEYILEILPMGIAIWPLKDTPQEMVDAGAVVLNQAFLEMYGYSEDSEFDFEYGGFSTLDTQSSDVLELRKAKELGAIGPYERTITRVDGSELPTRVNGRVLTSGDRQYLLLTIEDISDLHEVESALIKARVEAEGAARVKADFLANMSHEIRTPMAGIIGMAELCLKTTMTTSQRSYLSKIQSSANSLLSVINDVLDFSKIESGKLEIHQKEFLLSDLTHDLIDKVALSAEQKGIQLYFRIDPAIPLALIGDRFRLGQVLTNLTNNAIKFTSHGGEVFVNFTLQQKAGKRLLLSVSVKDTGVGISRDDQTRLFTEFSQLDNSASRNFGGTGLGLSISKRLVELMNGDIWVQSELGVGSEFSFTSELKFEDERNRQLNDTRGLLMGKKVLVADDNVTAKTLMIDMLKSFGCLVDHIGTTKLAEYLSACDTQYDVLLVDISERMVCQQVIAVSDTSSPYFQNLPVVGLTPLAVPSDKAQVLIDNVLAAIITRPVTSSAVFEALTEALNLTVILAAPEDSVPVNQQDPAAKLAGSKLLLAEDNDINQEVIVDMLESAGITVDVAANGAIAVDLVKENHYDGVLMDCQMPVMDGYQATQKIRSIKRFEQLPVIALTANVMEQDRQYAITSGMNDHIGKPIDLNDMLATLSKWVSPVGKPAAQDQSVKAKSQSLGDFPDLEGIDKARAIAITRGNSALYKRMLKRFASQYEHVDTELAVLFSKGDLPSIMDKAHALKGVSAHLGAKNLHGSSALLEHAAREGDNIESLLENVCTDLQFVTDSINRYFADEDADPTEPKELEPDLDRVAGWLKQLQQLVSDCDVEALSKIHLLRPFCESEQAQILFSQIEQSLQQFEFETAETYLLAMADELMATSS